MPNRSRVRQNPFEDATLAPGYEDWYSGPGRRADVAEKRLLARLLAEFPEARTALEIGCGTGHFTRWMASIGLMVTGLDASAPMIAEARTRNGVRYVEGDALQLPFDDRSFDLALLITTLEFVDDPPRALAEAVRVARRGLILGVLNRWSLLALRRRLSNNATWAAATFFGPGELRRLARAAAGERYRTAHWRTTLWPLPSSTDLPIPFGGFIGLAVHLET